MLAIVGAQPDRLVLQIVRGANEPDRLALRAHQDRMRDRACALRFHAAQERAVADSGRAEDNVLPVRQIVGEEDAAEIFFVPVGDQLFALLVIARPHHALHVAAEAFDPGRREHRFGRTADAHVKIDPALRAIAGAIAAAMSPSLIMRNDAPTRANFVRRFPCGAAGRAS